MRLFQTLAYVVILNLAWAETRNRLPARILARQTGATQFEEEHYEAHTNCNEHKHHLKKRASDEDVDYEVYQGVVGRPGIDFPIYPRIPKTSFSCRTYGNGYFADMETDCQVFHICEEGRKISFLCPNGTIFQQSELTCDWWFKVNCLGSSGFYADSAELLNKQKVQRLKPAIPVKGFNIVGGGLNIKARVPIKNSERSRINNKSERRIDSEEIPSLESIDFDDLSGEKPHKIPSKPLLSNIESNDNDNESQITAESSSFVNNHNRNDYGYEKSNKQIAKISHSSSQTSKKTVTERVLQSRHNYNNNQFNNESTERARKGQRGSQRYREEKKSQKLLNDNENYSINDNVYITKSAQIQQNTTPSYFSGTYSTAKRLETTRSTPFYTPTVPAIQKTKVAESKIKATTTANHANSHRFGPNAITHFQVFTESSYAPSSTTEISDVEVIAPTTIKPPVVIGMRHLYGEKGPSEVHRVAMHGNGKINIELPSQKAYIEKLTESTTTVSTGATYLPKNASFTKFSNGGASGDLLLFAPVPTAAEDAVSRNVNDMLKTMDMLKSKLEDVEVVKVNGKTRSGLDIPPSSGPDALISLAQYFATEDSETSVHRSDNLIEESLNKSKNDASTPLPTISVRVLDQKLSDTTTTLTTESSVGVLVKANDIKSGLLSNKTVDKYSTLFGLKAANENSTDPSEGLLSHVDNVSNTNITITPFPQIASTDATVEALAEKPESRKIAKVFSNALSSYLDDPRAFREQLEAARPTEPPIGGKSYTNFVTTTNTPLFNSGTAASYLPTTKLPSIIPLQTTEPPSIAAEINSNFDTSTHLADLVSTTEVFDYTTLKFSSEQKHSLELSAELEPPTPDSGEGEEFLQREQTQSFVNPLNQLRREEQLKGLKNTTSTTVKPTDNPWNALSEKDYLDPLMINDGLMKERKTKSSTITPNTYGRREISGPTTQSSHKLDVKSQAELLSESHYSSTEFASPRSINTRSESKDPWQDLFDTYHIPRESLPSSSGLQRIANKLFGGLNENEALHLKNVMAQAEHNRQVLSLLLLLIQTCDDQNGKALERSRKHLLNALIDMDGKINDETQGKTAYHKETLATTEKWPITTYRRTGSGEEITTSTIHYPSTSTEQLSTTNAATLSTLPSAISSDEQTTKFEIRVEDPEEEILTAASSNSDASSDKRALELLKSLYSLASKFTNRR
uniref:Chitin-binding type-2 domain-containing protein n=1 Tax=Glossina brevipalpis TaxID=37001 RepID=A0A1A9WL82_9MUSC